jgi:hypothetical protein
MSIQLRADKREEQIQKRRRELQPQDRVASVEQEQGMRAIGLPDPEEMS